MAFAQQVQAQVPALVERLVRQDLRLAGIAERLLAANRDLCRSVMPLTGMILHSRDQYRAEVAGAAFTNGPIAVAGVVPGSPAAAAAILPGDGVAAIGDRPAAAMVPQGQAPARDAAFAALAEHAVDRPLVLTMLRNGQAWTAALNAPSGCRALVEVRAADSLNARSDGRVIQVDYGLALRASDAELAVIFAHELAHLVLEHRRRLERAGVEKGFFGEFGRNRRLNREMEVEADRMSVHLLANAGYDPAIAPAFWRSKLGRRAAGGLFRSRVYPSPKARAELVEQEIAGYLRGRPSPSAAAELMARRDAPLD